MRIGIYGSAAGEMDEAIKTKARALGRAIAHQGGVVVTGGCPGLPQEAVLGAYEAGGQCIGFSPSVDAVTHQACGYPIEGFSRLFFVPKNFEYVTNDAVCKKYRNVMSVAYVDAAIVISGRIGTMNEFTIAYDLGRVIGVLSGTGGIADRAIAVLLEDSKKKSKATVVFESDPEKLVEIVSSQLQPPRV